ncbi:MAG: response regulator [Actinobacteria bacterium]|nr:response regulator [Actinomycetota bacterium]
MARQVREAAADSQQKIASLEREIASLRRDLSAALEQQTATSEILRVIASSPTDLQRVLDTLVESAARLCDATTAGIQQQEGDHLRVVASFGFSRFDTLSSAERYTLGYVPATPGTASGRAMLERRTIHIHDMAEAARSEYPDSLENQRRHGQRSQVVTPLLRGGVPIGILAVHRYEVRRFTDRQIDLLETFADQAVIAIENTRMFQGLQTRTQELARSVQELEALGEVGQAVSSTLDLQQMLTTIVAHADQLAGTDGGAIYEYDEATELLYLRATQKFDAALAEILLATPLQMGEGAVGRAAVARGPVQIPDMLEAGAYQGRLRETLTGAGYRAVLALPLLREDRVLGGLVLSRKSRGEFPPNVVDLVKTFASQSSVAIQNARLFREIEDKSLQLEVVSRHKSEFLANMSHELRTPLNAIIGFSEVLLEKMFGELNDKQAEYLRDILTSGQHLLSLINDILDLSKVEAGRMELETASFSLREALENGLTMLKERAGRHGVALELEVDPHLDVIEADERKLKQVVFNLLSNAVKFTPDGGRVEVTAHRVDGDVQVAVSDTGVGIAPEDQERIFEEFRQVGQGSAKAEGTGLGLALTRRLVELQGGRIWVESEVGAGSTFTFTLPAARSAPPNLPTHEVAPAESAGAEPSGPMILVVEDDRRAAELLRLQLEGAGFAVAVARDGEEGLTMARRLSPAAISLDITLPRLDGWEFLARANADPALAEIPVIIVSMLDERGTGFALGAAGYLVKPVSRDDLLTALRRVLPGPDGPDGPATILAIDDDPMAIELIEAVLAPEGYAVLKATGGEAGVDLARRERPALVILDLMMPEVDGFAVVERLRADPATSEIPIVVLTAKTMTPEEKARVNGRIAHLAEKGTFDRAGFVGLVRRLCPTPADRERRSSRGR